MGKDLQSNTKVYAAHVNETHKSQKEFNYFNRLGIQFKKSPPRHSI